MIINLFSPRRIYFDMLHFLPILVLREEGQIWISGLRAGRELRYLLVIAWDVCGGQGGRSD